MPARTSGGGRWPIPWLLRDIATQVGISALKREPSAADCGDEMPPFSAWLESPVIHVVIRRQHDQYYATADRFGIAGVGATKAAALRDVAGLVEAYLRSYFDEGRPFVDAIEQCDSRPPLRPKLLPALVVTLFSEIVGRVFERRLQLVLPGALPPR